MVQQGACEVVVVDYDCPNGTASWVNSHYPGVSVVKIENAPRFNAARAHNFGAAAATGDWLFFVDADVQLNAQFVASIRQQIAEGAYYRPAPISSGLWGSVVVSRADFGLIGGYDETIDSYGGEDDDFFLRLSMLGLRQTAFPAALLSGIPHDNNLRVQFRPITDVATSQRANIFYVSAKADASRLLGRQLNADEKRALFDEVWRAVKAAGDTGAANVDIDLPLATGLPIQRGWRLSRRLSCRLSPDSDVLKS